MGSDLLLQLGVVVVAVMVAFGMSALVGLLLGLVRSHPPAFGPSPADRPPRAEAGTNDEPDRSRAPTGPANPGERGLVRRADRPGGRGAP